MPKIIEVAVMRYPLNKFLSGDSRSVKAKKNILASGFIKGADTLVYLLLVPLTLGYLNAYEYGIWLTLNSILSWINSFDIGLGNGLRNKLAAAIAEGDKEKGRSYVSTTFFMLIILMVIIFVVASCIIYIVDWYGILNVDEGTVSNLREIVLISFLFFCINFVLKFIGNVYQALQLPAINYLISFGGHLLSLVVIFILTKTIPGSLLWVAVVYSAAPPIVYAICYPVTFAKLYPYLSPSLKLFDIRYLKELLSLSVLFFIIQIMGILLFSLSNVLISNMFGPDSVTPYNISNRYFSVVSLFFNLMLAPIWSAATDAYTKNDMQWIRNSIYTLVKFLAIVAVVIIIMIIVSDYVYLLWVGESVEIPKTMSILMGIYIFIVLWSLSFSSILNGMSKLRLQTINILLVGIAFYPLCHYLGNIFGIIGILMGMCILNLSGAVLNTIQLWKIVNNKAGVFWSK